ncbi:protein yellow-like [Adelges cooleyi]|uniref:protein yellow-like n=1 Tax=Adelges cooleyi TaxID=133065 RepID=UPI00217F4852|nr:protein yellow-like [Adelges cooleyi]
MNLWRTDVLVVGVGLILAVVRWAPPATNGRPALAVDQLTYILSGSHLKWFEPGERTQATDSGEYAARNVVPSRFAMRYDGLIFVAMPKLKPGVMFTLGVVEYEPCLSTIEPPIAPYPCAAAHRKQGTGNGWTMVNVVDVYMDEAGRLWALDVGKINLLGKTSVVRPPMVFAIDTGVDEFIHAIDLSRATTEASCLQSIIVDSSTSGETFLYIADAGQAAVIVYNVHCDRSFKVHVPVGPCGRQDILYMALTSVNEYILNGGHDPYGLGTGRDDNDFQRRLYVTYLSSCQMLYVPVYELDEIDVTYSLSAVGIGRKPCKMILLGTDRSSVIYFRPGETNDIWSWDTSTPFHEDNFKFVQYGRTTRVPLMVNIGFRGYQWYMESNFIDFLLDDIGCLGVSTKIQPLQIVSDELECRPALPLDNGPNCSTDDAFVCLKNLIPFEHAILY